AVFQTPPREQVKKTIWQSHDLADVLLRRLSIVNLPSFLNSSLFPHAKATKDSLSSVYVPVSRRLVRWPSPQMVYYCTHFLPRGHPDLIPAVRFALFTYDYPQPTPYPAAVQSNPSLRFIFLSTGHYS
ncbi:unnamed protein product, partial [Ectocarpus sp. 4 AP-2014]